MRDRVGEGKASGNLGNTYKMLGRFDEAVECCKTHLNISRELSDQVSVRESLVLDPRIFLNGFLSLEPDR